VENFLKVAKDLEEFDEKNPDHLWLSDFIDRQGMEFYQKGGEHRIQNGKKFLPRAHYSRAVRAGKADQYWTFSDEDIVDLIEVGSSQSARQKVEAEIKRLERYGFKREGISKQDQSSGKGAEEEEEEASPKATNSGTPGPSSEAGASGDKPNPIFSSLGY